MRFGLFGALTLDTQTLMYRGAGGGGRLSHESAVAVQMQTVDVDLDNDGGGMDDMDQLMKEVSFIHSFCKEGFLYVC